MTLLELVVGLTVTGVVVSAGVGAVAMLTDRRDQLRITAAEDARAAAERQVLVAWLGGAHLTAEEGGPDFRGLDGVHEEIQDDALSFLTTAETPLGSGETLVQLYVDRDERTPEHGLVAAFSAWRGTETKRLEIDPRVAGLETRYLSGVLGNRVWLPSWVSSTILPAGVEVQLLGDSLPPLLSWPIVVPLGAGR
jgi:type II secretory pathway pseudopilin PulG